MACKTKEGLVHSINAKEESLILPIFHTSIAVFMVVLGASMSAPACGPSSSCHSLEVAAWALVVLMATISSRTKDTPIVAIIDLTILVYDAIGITINLVILRASARTPGRVGTIATNSTRVDAFGTILRSHLCLVAPGRVVADVILHSILIVILVAVRASSAPAIRDVAALGTRLGASSGILNLCTAIGGILDPILITAPAGGVRLSVSIAVVQPKLGSSACTPIRLDTKKQ